MVSIVEYGVGNLFSLESSFAAIGEAVEITGDREKLLLADRIILPGVGAFGDAAALLRESGLDEVMKTKAASGTPIMGICLGMQLLFDSSEEYGRHEGLGLISGNVAPLENVISKDLKIPHIGWNALRFKGKKHPIFRYISEGDYVYFVHSYYGAHCLPSTIAVTDYSAEITAAVASGNVCGCQFHPEKSGKTGLSILKAFCEWNGKA